MTIPISQSWSCLLKFSSKKNSDVNAVMFLSFSLKSFFLVREGERLKSGFVFNIRQMD